MRELTVGRAAGHRRPAVDPHHCWATPRHLTAFTAESFGGPDTFSREMGGFASLIQAHRGLNINEEQRQRFVELYLAAADRTGLPDDEPFREALRSHVDFGSHVAMQNSHAKTDDELHPLREVPLWQWPDATP